MGPQARNRDDGVGGAELGPLPGGHHGLSREQIAESQRERLLAAMAQLVAAGGYRTVTITTLVKAASVSTRDFYDHFESVEQCFLAAFDAVFDHLKGMIGTAVADEPNWPAKVVAALRAALDFFGSEPELARLCLLEPVTATPSIAIRFRAAILEGAAPLAAGRKLLSDGAELPDSTEDSLLGGVVSLASRSLLAEDAGALPSHLPDMVEFLLSPYLGQTKARKLAAAAGEASGS